MPRYLLSLTILFAMWTGDTFIFPARADGIAVVHRPKKVRSVIRLPDCEFGTCVRRHQIACPDRYSCYSLYGAYGPYGGQSYWARYTSDGWRAAIVVRRR
jgi:hypothetical protein